MIDIIATIGPSSWNYRILNLMHKEGMTIGRINTKYASKKECLEVSDKLRNVGCKVLIDISGDKMLSFIKNLDFDYLAVSFTESEEQIRRIRSFFKPRKIFFLSKIESKKGIENIHKIIKASDGVLVARGDLGTHLPIEKVPLFQKLIIKKCNSLKKYVITATEMLLSMVVNKRPTRAEVSDVANAVLDGSNALMLSEETAIGKHPILAVKMMRKVIEEIEKDKILLRKGI